MKKKEENNFLLKEVENISDYEQWRKNLNNIINEIVDALLECFKDLPEETIKDNKGEE